MSEAMTDRDVCESITKQAGNGLGQARLMAKLRMASKAFDALAPSKEDHERIARELIHLSNLLLH